MSAPAYKYKGVAVHCYDYHSQCACKIHPARKLTSSLGLVIAFKHVKVGLLLC